MIQETSDTIIVEKLLQQGSESSSNGPLNIIRDLCNGSVMNIEQDQEARSTLLELANWAAENWKNISEQVKTNRAVLDVCQEQNSSADG